MKTLLLCALLLLPSVAWAIPIEFVRTVVDPDRQTVAVTVQFQAPPDFYSTDQYGRQADEFAFYAYDRPAWPTDQPYENLTSVTLSGRIAVGEGLHSITGEVFSGRVIGPPLETVPFFLEGSTLTYTASLRGFGDANGDGKVGFYVGSISYGGSPEPPPGLSNGHYLPQWFMGCVSDSVCANTPLKVPEPESWLLLLGGLLGLFAIGRFQSRRDAA